MPIRLCIDAGCPNPAAYRGRCVVHARTNDKATHSETNRKVYNSKRWKQARRKQLFDHPLCQCPNPDCHEIATDVDHVIPIEQGGAIWDRTNHQSLARSCHSAKTRQEQRGAA